MKMRQSPTNGNLRIKKDKRSKRRNGVHNRRSIGFGRLGLVNKRFGTMEDKKIFSWSEETFMITLWSILEEFIEDKYYEGTKIPEKKEFSGAIQLLGRIFKYVKRLQPEYQTMNEILKSLQLMLEEREVAYLINADDHFFRDVFLSEIKNAECNKEILLATQLLDYFHRAWSPCCQSMYDLQFSETVQQITKKMFFLKYRNRHQKILEQEILRQKIRKKKK